MKFHTPLLGAVVIVVLLTGMAIAPADRRTAPLTPAAAPLRPSLQMRGFCMRMVDPTESGVEKYLRAIDDFTAMGCTWISLPIAAHQDTVRSEAIKVDWKRVPSQRDLERIIRHAKSRGMGVMVMPTVLISNTGPKDWRGVIKPDNWDNWFASYNLFLATMARVAQAGGADVLCVGSELLSTESFRDRWIETIAQVRVHFKGKLTYSANWDHYEPVTFWDQVDYIGMNNYHELARNPGAPVDQLNRAWLPIKEKLLAFAVRQNKPFIFTEVGWHNLETTLSQPWNYVATSKIDHQEQHRAYQSFVETWRHVPNEQFMGAFIWEWWPDGKPTDHGSYSLQGTPALDVVRNWMIAP